MEYAFIGMMIPEEMSETVFNISKKNMQDAANALQWSLYNGLCQNLNSKITLINVLPLGSYPQYCETAFVKRSTFKTEYCDENINVGFCNIKLIRKYAQSKNLYRELKKWVKLSGEEKTLFVYTASAVFLKAVKKIKKKYPEIKVCDIIADLPAYVSLASNKTGIAKLYLEHSAKTSAKCLDAVDYFVLLTKQMADYLQIKKPFCVMEGISTKDSYLKLSDARITDSEKKIVFYSGTLHKKFGVMTLLSAFETIDDKDYVLQLCGVGDCEKEIERLAEQDKRIQFLGRVARNEVLELQKKATVLVNPRQNNEEFTKYSFPSKNLEYLSSGIPLVAYKLDGIPNEYDNYILYVEDDSIEALARRITEVCEMDSDERLTIGKKAKEFVLREKNQICQTRKILDLISE